MSMCSPQGGGGGGVLSVRVHVFIYDCMVLCRWKMMMVLKQTLSSPVTCHVARTASKRSMTLSLAVSIFGGCAFQAQYSLQVDLKHME